MYLTISFFLKKMIKLFIYFNLCFFILLQCSCSSKLPKETNVEYEKEKKIGILMIGGVIMTQTSGYLEGLIDSLKRQEISTYTINLDANIIDEAIISGDPLLYCSNVIEEFRLKHNLDKVIVIGHSWGGTVALQYSLLYSMNIHKVILLNCGGISSDFYEKPLFRVISEEFPRELKDYFFLKITEHMANYSSVDVYELSDSLIFYQLTYNKDVFQTVWNSFLKSEHDDVYQAALSAFFRRTRTNKFDLEVALLNTDLNVVNIVGIEDFYTKNTSEKIEKLVENSKKITIDSSGHFPWIEKPHSFYPIFFEELKW